MAATDVEHTHPISLVPAGPHKPRLGILHPCAPAVALPLKQDQWFVAEGVRHGVTRKRWSAAKADHIRYRGFDRQKRVATAGQHQNLEIAPPDTFASESAQDHGNLLAIT